MIICNEKVGVELLLQFQEVLEGPKIVAQVQFSGGTDPADYHFFHGHKIRKITGDLNELTANEPETAPECVENRGIHGKKAVVGVFLRYAQVDTIEVYTRGDGG